MTANVVTPIYECAFLKGACHFQRGCDDGKNQICMNPYPYEDNRAGQLCKVARGLEIDETAQAYTLASLDGGHYYPGRFIVGHGESL